MATSTNLASTTETNIKCPYCAEVIAAAAKKCKHCGEFLDQTLRQARMQTPAVQQRQQTWNAGTAAVLSLIPGTGQIYKGQILVGRCWFVGVFAGYAVFIVPGVILHIVCIYNAYSYDPNRANEPKALADQPARAPYVPQKDVLYKAGRAWSRMTK